MARRPLIFVAFAVWAGSLFGQPGPLLVRQVSSTSASLRGLCVVDPQTVWASGTQGTVVRTFDGGTTWQAVPVDGAETRDFRDIQAFSQNEALVMAAGSPAFIYRTTDAGRKWHVTYTNEHPDMFLDAIAFWDDRRGMAFGDPIDGRWFLIQTTDGGEFCCVSPCSLQRRNCATHYTALRIPAFPSNGIPWPSNQLTNCSADSRHQNSCSASAPQSAAFSRTIKLDERTSSES
jgi:hypothetical protein